MSLVALGSLTMLIKCHHCNATINNRCTDCPWCTRPRVPIVVPRTWQFGLAGLLIVVSVLGIWLGLALRGPVN